VALATHLHSLAVLNGRIALVRDNIRRLVEQAAASLGAPPLAECIVGLSSGDFQIERCIPFETKWERYLIYDKAACDALRYHLGNDYCKNR
jgi:hypothetical protein